MSSLPSTSYPETITLTLFVDERTIVSRPDRVLLVTIAEVQRQAFRLYSSWEEYGPQLFEHLHSTPRWYSEIGREARNRVDELRDLAIGHYRITTGEGNLVTIQEREEVRKSVIAHQRAIAELQAHLVRDSEETLRAPPPQNLPKQQKTKRCLLM